jgi:MFS family permease
MDAATQSETAKLRLATFLAGLEGGTVGVLWMLAWLGVSSLWQQRSFWAPENLMATAFDRSSNLAPLFTWATCAGLALYVLIYSVLGAAFSSLLGDRVPRRRVMLTAVIFAIVWYYFSFRWTFKLALPLVALLHVEHSTLVGHLLYGTMLGRYPLYVHRLMNTAPPVESGPKAVGELAPERAYVEVSEERQGLPPGEPPEKGGPDEDG